MPQKYLKILKKSNLTAHKGLRSIEWGVICLAAVNGTRTCSTELLEINYEYLRFYGIFIVASVA